MGSAKAFSPGGITSFFEPHELRPVSKGLPATLLMAARGGGFTTARGTTTSVTAHRARDNRIEILINKRPCDNCYTTEAVASLLLKRTDKKFTVRIEHDITIPVGAGYGTSAAGALSTALAMNDLLGLNMTFDDLGFFAHAAEMRCETGLGTVGPLMVGGCIVQREGGPPGLCRIDRIPLKPSYRIISGCYGPISTRTVLRSKTILREIGREGRRAMRSILSRPNLRNFLQASEEFASRIGFMTERVERLIATAKLNGAVGATQNMIGEAFHAVVEEPQAEEVMKALRKAIPTGKLFTSRIDFEGARLL